MSGSRMHNARRNIAMGIVNKIVMMLIPFLTRTAIIYCLGALYLGLNSLYSSILNVLSLAELGFSSAMVFSMYEPMAQHNADAVSALLKLYRKIYRIVGCVIVGIGLVILIPLPHLIKGEVPQDVSIYWLYLIYLGNTGLSYFLYAYKESVLVADQRSDVVSNINTVLNIVVGLVQLVVLIIFKNYYVFCFVYPVSTVIKNFVTKHIVDKRYPEYGCYGEVPGDELQEIKKRVGGLFIYKVCYVFRDSFAAIIVSAFLGLTVLGKFNNYLYLCTAITGFMTIIKTSITAGIGNSIVTESQQKNYDDFKKCQLLYMWLSAWCTVCLFCLIQPFIKLWAGEDYLFNFGVMALFCIQFFCYKLGDICAVYRQAAGLWWQDRIRPIVEAITCLGLSFALVKPLGVSGVLLATIVCLICINSIWASWVLFKYYFTEHRQLEYIGRIAFYLIVTAVTVVVSCVTCHFIPWEGWLGLVVKGLVCVILPNLVLIPLLHILPEYKGGVEVLKRIVKTK